jgi:hypothetical protein
MSKRLCGLPASRVRHRMGGFMDGHTCDRSAMPILDRHSTCREPLSQHFFQALGHRGASLASAYDIHVCVTLQIIGNAVNIQRVTLAHERTPHCGNRINRCYSSGKDVSAILTQLLDRA